MRENEWDKKTELIMILLLFWGPHTHTLCSLKLEKNKESNLWKDGLEQYVPRLATLFYLKATSELQQQM